MLGYHQNLKNKSKEIIVEGGRFSHKIIYIRLKKTLENILILLGEFQENKNLLKLATKGCTPSMVSWSRSASFVNSSPPDRV